jgi:murein tripeptide amidase MpaA
MTSAAIESCLVSVSTSYPTLATLIALPEPSVEGRVIRALRVRAGSGDRHGVLLVGGTHAREIINPDLLAGLALKLCWAYANNASLTFGAKTWASAQIRQLLDGLEIFILPLLNPDGREYVFSPTGYAWWRKNRSVNADGTRGTDLNRNYDFLWQWAIGSTSTVPGADTYRGSAPFSEPETRNVRWLLDTNPRIGCFADVHSYSELVLYPWGDDNNQTADPTQNFQNAAWNGLRGAAGSGYAEHIPAPDWTQFVDLASQLRDAIAAVRGRVYTVQQSFDLYGTSGVSSDYAYSRGFLPGGLAKVWGVVLETNRAGPNNDWQYGFQPPFADAQLVIDEVQSGLLQFMTSCWGLATQTTVPDVRELTRAIASNQVRAAGLVPRYTGSTSASAWVYSQSPQGGAVASRGSTVTLGMRTGPIP